MKRRLTKDKGNAVIILGIFLVGLILLVAIFIVDLSKGMYIKNMYTSFASKSVQTAIKEQDFIGGLKFTSAQKVVDEYMLQRNGSNHNTKDAKAYASACDKLGKYPIIQIKYDNKRALGASGTTYSSVNGSPVTIPKINDFFRNQYNTIEVTITDVTDNYFYGIFGVPCAEIHVKASAITATSQDEDDFEINR